MPKPSSCPTNRSSHFAPPFFKKMAFLPFPQKQNTHLMRKTSPNTKSSWKRPASSRVTLLITQVLWVLQKQTNLWKPCPSTFVEVISIWAIPYHELFLPYSRESFLSFPRKAAVDSS